MKTIYLKFLLIMLSLLATFSSSIAQGFNDAHGLPGNDEFRTIVRLNGGDYVVGGTVSQNGGDLYVARYTAAGALVWERRYGNAGAEIATASLVTATGNIVLAGTTTSFSTVGTGLQDILVLEIDPNGTLQWIREYGRNNDLNDVPNNINLTAGGIGICGFSVTQGSNSPDMLAMEISNNGSVINWQRSYNGTGDIGYQLISSASGGYLMVGGSDDETGEYDQVFMRLNATGNIISAIAYGSTNLNENAHQIIELPGGAAIVMGNYRGLSGAGLEFALTRIATNNTITWSRTYGDNGAGDERSFSFIPTNAGGYALVGQTTGFGLGSTDILTVLTDANGNMTGSFSIGQQNNDFPYDIVQNTDGSFTIAGLTGSFGSGLNDGYLIGTNTLGAVVGNCSRATPIQRNVVPTVANISTNFTVANPALANNIPAINNNATTLTVVSQSTLSINGVTQICINNNSTFTTNRPQSNVTWAVTSGNATIAAQTGTSITLNFTAAGVVTLSATLGSCVATHQINVDPGPILSFVGLNNNYCVGAPDIALVATPVGGTFTVNGIPATTLSAATVGTYAVAYSNTNTSGCSSSISRNVVINPLPVVSITGIAPSYCSGYYDVALTGTPSGGVFTVDGQVKTLFEPSVIGTHTITYTYTSAVGCSNTTSITTEVTDCCKYKIGDLTGICGATNTLCVPLTATMPVDKGIIGMDYCLQYDPTIMTPTGNYTLGTLVTRGTASWANAFLNTTVAGQVRASIHYTSTAPAGTLFRGSGDVICIEFRLLGSTVLGTTALSSCELEEAYTLSEKTACWEAGSMTIDYDPQMRGRLIYQGNTNKSLGMGYTVTNSNMAVTNISGTDATCTSNTVVTQPNNTGNFTLPITNSAKLKIIRDIKTPPNNNTYATMRYINGYDTYLMQNITTLKTTGPSVVLPTAYMMIAADVNMNDKVRANDITLVQERIVRKISEFPQVWNSTPNPAAPSLDWRYIDKRTADADPTFQRSATYPLADGSGFHRDDVPQVPFCLPVRQQCQNEAAEIYSGILLGDLFDGGPLSFGNPQQYPTAGNPYLKQAAPNKKEGAGNLVNFEVDDIAEIGDNLYRIYVRHGGLSDKDTLISIDFTIRYDSKEISVIDLGKTAECTQSNVSMMWNDSQDSEIILTSFSMNTYPSSGTLFYIDVLKPSGRPVASDFDNAIAFLNGVEVPAGVNLRSAATTSVSSSITENAVSIVPNPATEAAYIYYTFSKSSNARIEVLNNLGQSVANYNGLSAEGSIALDVRTLAKGVYHCIISDGVNKVVKKLIVQ